MGIAGALSALSYMALAGAAVWLISLIRKVGRLEQENADLRESNAIKTMQLEAANKAPRSRLDAIERLRDGGGL